MCTDVKTLLRDASEMTPFPRKKPKKKLFLQLTLTASSPETTKPTIVPYCLPQSISIYLLLSYFVSICVHISCTQTIQCAFFSSSFQYFIGVSQLLTKCAKKNLKIYFNFLFINRSVTVQFGANWNFQIQ